MSPHNIHSFVGDLVAMAQAMDALPKVQAELDEERADHDMARERIQSLELRLIDRANELAALRASLAGVEAERDDATRAFLEADDATQRALDVIKTFMGNAGDFLRTLEPPMHMDAPVPTTTDVVSDTVGVEPTTHPEQIDDPRLPEVSVPSNPTPATTDGGAGTSDQSEGVSVPADPIANSVAGDGPSHETATPAIFALNEADATTQASPVDDVGYHNEPDYKDHAAWNVWLDRMNARYGQGQLPLRYPLAAQ